MNLLAEARLLIYTVTVQHYNTFAVVFLATENQTFTLLLLYLFIFTNG